MYGYYDDTPITQEQVLQKVTQEQIFELVFKETIDQSDRYLSPFRKDNNPNCRFQDSKDGSILLFIDFGDKLTTHRNCFKAVMDKFNLTHDAAIRIILSHFGLSDKKEDYQQAIVYIPKTTEDIPTTITYDRIPYQKKDSIWWSQFLIQTSECLEDNVYATNRFRIEGRKGKKSIPIFNLGYAMDFITRHKIYQPQSRPEFRWITNCDENDIGNFDNLPATGELLTIAKSYKDHRVVRNTRLVSHVIWVQNEGCVPDLYILIDIARRFKTIVIFFDNDEAGVKAALKLCNLFNEIREGCCKMVHLPVPISGNAIWKDPGQFISKEGKQDLITVLKQIYSWQGIYL